MMLYLSCKKNVVVKLKGGKIYVYIVKKKGNSMRESGKENVDFPATQEM